MRPRLPLSRLVLGAILGLGLLATVLRFLKGLGYATYLSDRTPWGLWIGFDVLCGVALAAGGFVLTAIVHIFAQKKYYPILRSTVLTAFLGYVLVCSGLAYDLGRPQNMWHVVVMGNPHSVMFEVAWCVMLYTAVLFIEFSPAVLERLGLHSHAAIIHKIAIPLVLVGVLLSTLHQSSLGTLFLIVPEKLYKLWYTPYLPVMFFISAVVVGFAMVILESYLSSYFLKKRLEKAILVDITHFLLVAILFYLGIKFQDLFARRALGALWAPRIETYCFWLEIALLALPAAVLAVRRMRVNENAAFLCSVSVVLGVVVNRLNVSLVGFYSYNHSVYLPSFYEVAISVFLVTVGVVVFGLAVKYLNIYESETPGRGLLTGRIAEA